MSRFEDEFYPKYKLKYSKLGYVYVLEFSDFWAAIDFRNQHGDMFFLQAYDKFLFFKDEAEFNAAKIMM